MVGWDWGSQYLETLPNRVEEYRRLHVQAFQNWCWGLFLRDEIIESWKQSQWTRIHPLARSVVGWLIAGRAWMSDLYTGPDEDFCHHLRLDFVGSLLLGPRDKAVGLKKRTWKGKLGDSPSATNIITVRHELSIVRHGWFTQNSQAALQGNLAPPQPTIQDTNLTSTLGVGLYSLGFRHDGRWNQQNQNSYSVLFRRLATGLTCWGIRSSHTEVYIVLHATLILVYRISNCPSFNELPLKGSR